MIEWLNESPTDAALRDSIAAAIADPSEWRGQAAARAYQYAVSRLEDAQKQVFEAQEMVNACATAVRAQALREVSK
jgi:hypothetical protein